MSYCSKLIKHQQLKGMILFESKPVPKGYSVYILRDPIQSEH